MERHEYHAESDGCGSFIVRDEFGHPAVRHSGSLAMFALRAVAEGFAAQMNRSHR